MKVVLDTDIGTDIDDALALALLLASPEVALLGITCAYGDTTLRARIAQKLLALRGVTGIPVFAGATRPLMNLRPIYWEGHEGGGLLGDGDAALAPTAGDWLAWLVETATNHPREVHWLAIAPLTNVALALTYAPQLRELLAGITIMGGVVRANGDFSLPIAEHNILCDPDAAHIVFSAGVPITLAPLNITVQARIGSNTLAHIRAAGTPFHSAIADQLAAYPRFVQYGYTSPHDPLAVATLLQPQLFEYETVTVSVETAGRVGTGAIFPQADSNGHIRLVTGVNAPALEAFLTERWGQ